MAIDLTAYADGIEADLAELRKGLALLESGEVTHRQKEGSGPWRDVTREIIDHDKKVIENYEQILIDVRDRIRRGV